MNRTLLTLFAFLMSTCSAMAQSESEQYSAFKTLYKQELGSANACASNTAQIYKICSDALKNEGNSPYILHHGKLTEKTAVLFHGLSDSPFFFKSIAGELHAQGFTVVVALLPGHGKKDADADMEDDNLAKRWQQHVSSIMAFSSTLSEDLYIGGFSTGGALAAQHLLLNPDSSSRLMLFSGALALDESVESMSGVWGIKLLAKLLDGDYDSYGPNPFKYPKVAGHTAFMLTDVIFDVRDELEKGNKPNWAIFTAHSMADTTTPWSGIESLLSYNSGPEEIFKIDESLNVCHADVVVNAEQIKQMNYDTSQVDTSEKCSVPVANPQHDEMLNAMVEFVRKY